MARFSLTKSIALSLSALLVAVPNSSFAEYSEKRPDNFVLSEETPVSTGHGFIGNYSMSSEPIDILSHGMHFRVPRNYLVGILDNTRDHMVDFTIETLYPDFAGVKEDELETRNHGIIMRKITPNLIRMFSTYRVFSPEHDPNIALFNEEKDQPDHPWKYGLLKSTERSRYISDVYFQRPSKNNAGFMTSCPRGEDGLGICNAYLRISPTLVMQYQFHRELLPHWQEINDKMTKLVQSFIVKEK